jgi:Flp pilus assembly protein CpaB
VFGSSVTTVPIISFKIPAGENALAVQMNYFPGGGGYVQDGDSVNVYAVVKAPSSAASTAGSGSGSGSGSTSCSSDPRTSNSVTLIQTNIKVLSVIGQPPAQVGQPTSFLLAVTPQVAAQLIYHETFESLYFSLTSAGQAPAGASPITCTNAL